jgi:hypothetical protein
MQKEIRFMKTVCCFAVSIFLLAGCSSISVSRDYDASADFSSLETYAWQHAAQPETGNPRIDNDLMDARVRRAVDAQMAEKGFELVPAAEADFLVAYFFDYKRRISGNSVSFGMGAGTYRRYGGAGYNTSITDYDEGHLTIDIIHPASGNNIWRGIGRRTTYEGSNPEKVTRIVNAAVAKILAGFPPVK